jgi:broad specificity phosphatase PhoE
MSTDAINAENQAAAVRPPAAARARSGAIVLARHGEPGLSRKVRLNAAEYSAWWARYEETGLLAGQTAPAGLVAQAGRAAVILSSTRIRSIETAKAVAGDAPFESHPELIEAPLPPPGWPSWFRLSPRHWGVVSRFWWWFFNHHAGHETRAQAEVRAAAAAERLIELAESGGDVLVVAHGFFNAMIGRMLKRRGWRLTQSQGYKYWSMRRFVRRD